MQNKTDRWQMNRIGFVNFWLYDEQDFLFADGKLLLRGANGSGKSITTQSFIPFILDGNRSPERLDPFGSRDRKMDYYLIGVQEKEEATGYLFLEFKKEESEMYRTIGIGLRAQKGKNMNFWGFCLKDGRRVGYDFFLYREAGSKKIPLTKAELKKELAEDCFTESSGEYMEMVNRYLFGFQRLEQYDQFIRLLIKVRAPKLSKEFTPSKVYDILNSSLQTLSNEDLRAMVDAMEKMDEIQSRLESYREGYRDAGIIKVEYDRYNQYMLGQKAAVYQQLQEKMRHSAGQLKLLESEIHHLTEELEKGDCELAGYKEERETLEHEKIALQDGDLVRAVERGKQIQEEIDQGETEQAREEAALGSVTDKREEAYRQLKNDETNISQNMEAFEKQIGELEETQEILRLDSHGENVKEVRSLPGKTFYQSFREHILYTKKQIHGGLQALKQQEKAESEYSHAEEEWQTACVQTDHGLAQVNQCRQQEDEERDRLIEGYYRCQANNEELSLNGGILNQVTEIVTRYQGMGEDKELQDLLTKRLTEVKTPLEELRLTLRHKRSQCQGEWEAAQSHLQELIRMKDPSPDRSEKTKEARAALEASGIPFHSFYEAVDFAPAVSAEARILLEEQLKDAEVLDALVVPSAWMGKAVKTLGLHSDRILRYAAGNKNSAPQNGNDASGFDKLVPSGISPEFDEAVTDVLRGFSMERGSGSALGEFSMEKEENGYGLTLNLDGTYYHGLLRGHSVADEPVGYIGAAARQQKRLEMIARQELAAAEWKQQIDDTKEKLEVLAEQFNLLQKEWEALPKTVDLIEAIDLVRGTENEYIQLRDISDRLEKNKHYLHELLQQKRQDVLTLCKGLPYLRKVPEYEEAEEAADQYERLAAALEQQESEIVHAKALESRTRDEIDRLEEQVDESFRRLDQVKRRLRVKGQELAAVEEILNKPENKERAQRLTQLENRLKELQEQIENQGAENSAMGERLTSRREALVQKKEQQQEGAAAELTAHNCYEEEWKLGFVFPTDEKSSEERLAEAASCLRESDRERGTDEMFNALNRNYMQHSSHLTAYQPKIDECFEHIPGFVNKRYNIRFTWNGQQLSLYEFHKLLKNTIEETELLIQEEDRKLFEDILADTLVHKLNYRIMESRKWIKDMSNLMQHMDTSMGLRFSLDWRGRTGNGGNELDTAELEKLFGRDRALLTVEDKEKVSRHFRTHIQTAKRTLEEEKQAVNYADLVRDALDYRQWFEFRMFFKKREKDKKELTNAAFNQFSGGEKAMAMYVPLFAAVSAQYQMADSGSPYIIALDEAFAGVDDKNISSMFELVETLRFGYIMNSQALWGCYETVKSLSICELLPSPEGDMITALPYYWNGKKRTLFEAAL